MQSFRFFPCHTAGCDRRVPYFMERKIRVGKMTGGQITGGGNRSRGDHSGRVNAKFSIFPLPNRRVGPPRTLFHGAKNPGRSGDLWIKNRESSELMAFLGGANEEPQRIPD